MGSLFSPFEPVLAVAHDPAFWSQYYFLSHPGVEYEGIGNYDEIVPPNDLYQTPGFTLKHCRLPFPVTGRRGVLLDFTCSLDYFSLDLLPGDGTQVELGWDDEAHWHPHVLRWDELELICKCLSVRDASFAHPGLALLLLCRWAPLTDTDDADHVLSLLRGAADRVGVTSPDLVHSLFARLDKRGNGFEWEHAPEQGWVLRQDNPLIPQKGFRYKTQLYTLRSPGNGDFPFAELNAMLRDAKEVCEKR